MQSDGGRVWQPEVAVPPGQKKPPRTTSLGGKGGVGEEGGGYTTAFVTWKLQETVI